MRAYHHTYGLPVTTSNCSNNYGPYQFPEKLIPLMLVNALEGKPLPVYGDGLNVRDWLYVEDHCRAVELVLDAGAGGRDLQRRRPERVAEHRHRAAALPPGGRGVRGRHRSGAPLPAAPAAKGQQTGIAHDLRARTGRATTGATRSTRRRSSASSGFAPAESFETGIRKTIAWYLANEAWWRGVMDGSYREWVGRWYGANA